MTPGATLKAQPPPSEARRVRAPLLRWYRRERRDLPWRRTKDPYAIWVSEIMLQQTQVATVIPYYERFLQKYPDAYSLASAPEEEVLAAWSGLGYYRRARGLRSGAQVVIDDYQGQLPADAEALQRIPGIGRYTAGAIASIAFDRPEPILDGNVRRVLSRLFALDASDVSRVVEDRWLWSVAAELVKGSAPGDFNQGLMELGARVCSPRAPRCESCPVASHCLAFTDGHPEEFPVTRATRASESVRVAIAWVTHNERILIERPGPGSPFRGTWDLPAVAIGTNDDAASALVTMLEERHGLEVRAEAIVARATHAILHRRLKLEAIGCRRRSGRVNGRPDLRWLDPAEIADIAVSGVTPKLIQAAASHASAATRSSERRRPRSMKAER